MYSTTVVSGAFAQGCTGGPDPCDPIPVGPSTDPVTINQGSLSYSVEGQNEAIAEALRDAASARVVYDQSALALQLLNEPVGNPEVGTEDGLGVGAPGAGAGYMASGATETVLSDPIGYSLTDGGQFQTPGGSGHNPLPQSTPLLESAPLGTQVITVAANRVMGRTRFKLGNFHCVETINTFSYTPPLKAKVRATGEIACEKHVNIIGTPVASHALYLFKPDFTIGDVRFFGSYTDVPGIVVKSVPELYGQAKARGHRWAAYCVTAEAAKNSAGSKTNCALTDDVV